MQIKPYSPVTFQDFIWVAEYSNGNKLTEYDTVTRKSNKLQDIKKQDLIRFGLIGLGYKIYSEVYGGYIVVNGQMFEFVYRVGDKDYYLTGQPKLYSDVITYKEAEATANVTAKGEPSGRFVNRITGFNFGYKVQLKNEDINFNFKVVYKLPYNQPGYMTFRLVADKALNGKLVIKRNGNDVVAFDAPLEVGIGGELSWVVK